MESKLFMKVHREGVRTRSKTGARKSKALRILMSRLPATGFALTSSHPISRSTLFQATHVFSMSHHPLPILVGETALILEDAPSFFVRQLPAKFNHAGTDRSVLDHPEDFAFIAMAPESRVLEIARRWIQLGCQRPLADTIFPMTVETGSLPVIERFALLDDLRRTRQRARECARFGQLVDRHQRLHHGPFGGPGWDGKRNHY